MSAAVDSAIIVRRVPLEFPAELDPMIVEGCPEESFMHVGLSLLLPYLEPYLIRSMRAAKPHVTDPALLADLDAFNGQEGQHYRQHMRFNETLRLAGFDQLTGLEAELDADYRRFTESKSLRFNLAYAEGFEAFTMALSRFSFESKLLDRMHPACRELFQWHLVEEIEHRTVTFDVYAHVFGGYFYRLFVGLYAQWHLCRFVFRVAFGMTHADPDAFRRKYGGFVAYWRRTRTLNWLALKGFLPKVLWTYLPWYTPHHIELPAEVKTLVAHYAGMNTGVGDSVAKTVVST